MTNVVSVQDVFMRNGRLAGRVSTQAIECWDGHTTHRYDGFAGGSHVGRWTDLESAVREVREYAERASFAWHNALCDTGAAHSDVCPLRPSA